MFNTLTRMGAAGAGSAYEIERSLRFNGADSAYLTRTPGSDGNLRVWTFSCWVKRGNVGTLQTFFSAGSNNPDTIIKINSDDQFEISNWSGGYVNQITTTRRLRDPASWYHLVGAVDTTQGTSSNRVKLYVNGSYEDTLVNNTYPSQNFDYLINDASYAHYIGRHPGGQYYDGYIAEFHFVDGTQLTASDFGETNATTGQWIPKEYTGSHGTNGFYLNFSDNSNTTSGTLGDDDSANTNDWTPNNLSVTADTAGNDSVIDTPTNNYATLNPLHWCVLKGAAGTSLGPDFTEGNLRFVGPSSVQSPYQRSTGSTMVVNSGAWYYEVTIENFGNGNNMGVAHANTQDANGDWSTSSGSWLWNCFDEQKNINGTVTSYGSRPSNGDVVGCAVDIDNNTIEWFVNNSSQGQVTSIGISGKPVVVGVITVTFANERYTVNFGQQGFKYTPPTGFNALNAANLPAPTIKKGEDHFNTVLYTGTGSDLAVTGVGFQPDLVWIKNRTAGGNWHDVYDVIRGVTKRIFPNEDDPEQTQAEGLKAFGSDGWTVGNNSDVGSNGAGYVGWNWKAGGSPSNNTNGTITTSVSANATAGFSIISYSGSGSAGTIGHGLGVAPQAIITKRVTGTEDWKVYHKDIQGGYFLKFNSNQVETSNTDVYPNTAPTSTVYSLGDHDSVNGGSDTYIAYCFTGVTGYSNFGSYKGIGSADGAFVYTGFKPAVLLVKCIGNTEDWQIWDRVRDPFNLMTHRLFPSNDDAGSTNTDVNASQLDFLSNGFKWKGLSDDTNGEGRTYAYLAFAESPFNYANAR